MNYKIRESLQNSSVSPVLVAIIGIVFYSSLAQAHAELAIHNGSSQQIITTAQATKYQSINNQIPTETSIIKLMQVMHIDEQIAAIINGQQTTIDIINSQTNSANQQTAGDKLNKRQRELQTKIQGILGQYTEMMSEDINEDTDAETMTQDYVAAARAYYTQAEVDAQIKFYDTPIGQSILAKQPQVTAAFLQQVLPKDLDMNEVKEQLNNLLPQMKQIIKDIL